MSNICTSLVMLTVLMWDWKGVLYYDLLENQIIHSNKYCSQLDQLKEAPVEKHPELGNKKCIIFHQDNVRPHVFLYGNTTIAWMGISDSSAVFTRHHTFRFPFIYKIFSGKISDPWKSVKGTCNSSLLKKIKSFGKTELWSCLKNGRRQQNKAVNTFNKVLGKNEKFVFYFSLKTEGTFWP